jgi:hypothetical protein
MSNGNVAEWMITYDWFKKKKQLLLTQYQRISIADEKHPSPVSSQDFSAV